MSKHITDFQIALFVENKLEKEELDIVRNHISECSECAQIFADTLEIINMDVLGLLSQINDDDIEKATLSINNLLNTPKPSIAEKNEKKNNSNVRNLQLADSILNENIHNENLQPEEKMKGLNHMEGNLETLTKQYSFEKECAPDDFRLKKKICGMIITYQCNLNCTYCYVPEKKMEYLDVKTSQEIIGNTQHSFDAREYNSIEYDFLGGEPLMAFDRIREICEWTWTQNWPNPYIFFIGTNGTLLNEDMKKWFSSNKRRIVLGLSYDGNMQMQNENRPFIEQIETKGIDLSFFQTNWPDQKVKMTISPKTISSLSEGCIFLHEKGFKIHANPAHGINWSKNALLQFAMELKKLADYYILHPEIEPVSLLNLDLRLLLNKNIIVQNKYCGAGTSISVYDIDGSEYPCQIFSPLSLSKEKLAEAKNINFSDYLGFVDEKCQNCILRQICPTCYGINYRTNGHPAIREEILCRMYAVQILSNCRFQKDRISRIPKEKLTQYDKQTAKAIIRVMDIWKRGKNDNL